MASLSGSETVVKAPRWSRAEFSPHTEKLTSMAISTADFRKPEPKVPGDQQGAHGESASKSMVAMARGA